MKIRCVAIDKNPQSLNVLEDSIKQFQYLDLVEEFTAPLQALKFLKEHKINFVCMSVEFKDSFGQQVISKLAHNPLLVMTETDCARNTFGGFNATNVDYVLNPTDYADFFRAITSMRQSNPQ